MFSDKIIEVNNFKLSYDGLFYAEFEYAKNKYTQKIYLTPQMFFKILHNEGLDKIDFIQSLDFYSKGVEFFKTTLLFRVFNEENEKISFLTSEEADHYHDFGFSLVHCEIKDDK